jgi:aminoglycoside phosphotransferase (APT) family kinase protein
VLGDDALEEVVRAALPSTTPWRIERVREGVSTRVYRLVRDRDVLYMRLADRPDQSLASEALAHELVRARGVRAPDVVHLDPFNEKVGCSVMITTAVEGTTVGRCRSERQIDAVLRDAGRDLALINSVPVRGFGWIRRGISDGDALVGALRTHRAFLRDEWEADLLRARRALGPALATRVSDAFERFEPTPDAEGARLAHGDFDATAIFQRNGRYTGVIDFGEIRGTHPLYDLGHFRLHADEALPGSTVASLIGGYTAVTPLSDDHARTINLFALVIGVRALARAAQRPRSAYAHYLGSAISAIAASPLDDVGDGH